MPLYLAYIQTIALAIIAGGSIVLGTFLVRGFKQQLENKQSEIDTLKTHIQHLEGLTAPALADQLKKLAPVVDEYAKKVADQETQLRTMGPVRLAIVASRIATYSVQMVFPALNELLLRCSIAIVKGNTKGLRLRPTDFIFDRGSRLLWEQQKELRRNVGVLRIFILRFQRKTGRAKIE